jgi:hypothetical protein
MSEAKDWTVVELVKNAKGGNVTPLQLYFWCADHCVFRWGFAPDDRAHFPIVKVGSQRLASIIRDMYIDEDETVRAVVANPSRETRTVAIDQIVAFKLTNDEDRAAVDRVMSYPVEEEFVLQALTQTLLAEKGGLVLIGTYMDDRKKLAQYDLSGRNVKYFPPPNPFVLGTFVKKPSGKSASITVKPWVVNGHFQPLDTRDMEIDLRGYDMIRYANMKDNNGVAAIVQAIEIAYSNLQGAKDFEEANFKITKKNRIFVTFPEREEETELPDVTIETLRRNRAIETILQTQDGQRYLKWFEHTAMVANSYFAAADENELLEEFEKHVEGTEDLFSSANARGT